MKGRVSFMVSCGALVMAVAIGGCVTSQPVQSPVPQPAQQQQPAQQPAAAKVNLVLGGGIAGGTGYVYSGAVTATSNQNTSAARISLVSYTGAIDGLKNLADGRYDIVVATTPQLKDANAGTGPFKDKPIKDLRILWIMYTTNMNIAVRADSGINTIYDLAGKRFAVQPKGSGTRATQDEMLKAAGLTDKVKLYEADLSGGTDAVRDGTAEGVSIMAAQGAPALMELDAAVKVKWLPVPDEVITKMIAANPGGYLKGFIPAGTYKNQTTALATVGHPLALVTTTRVAENIGYEITKAFFNNFAQAKSVHALIGSTPDLKSLPNAGLPVPLHGGVLKYLSEQK